MLWWWCCFKQILVAALFKRKGLRKIIFARLSALQKWRVQRFRGEISGGTEARNRFQSK
jgi:hypothetical protein